MENNSKPTKCDCPIDYAVGVEYSLLDPNHYDGISEWQCAKCAKRWGRWTGKELKPGEFEPPYGTASPEKINIV